MYLVFYQSQCRGILDLRYLFLCIGRIFFYRDCFTRPGIHFWTACITHNMNIYSPNYENYAIYRVYYLALEQCFARTELL